MDKPKPTVHVAFSPPSTLGNRQGSTESSSGSTRPLSSSTSSSSSCLDKALMDTEREAFQRLEKARVKPVAFAVRTNVSFDGALDDDSPVHGSAVSFGVGDFLHIMERYDHHWWIGRKVQIHCELGYIPSPAKLETLRIQLAQNRTAKLYATKATQNSASNLVKLLPKTPVVKNVVKSNSSNNDENDNDTSQTTDDNDDSNNVSLKEPEKKRRGLLSGPKRVEPTPPYEVVPSMRPVVLIGPSLKGFEVTDMMQKALFDHLRRHFDKRLIITRVRADLSLGRKNNASVASDANNEGDDNNDDNEEAKVSNNAGLGAIPKGNSTGNMGMSSASRISFSPSSPSVSAGAVHEAQREISRIFELAKTLQLVVLDCDQINHPSQLAKTQLAPITVYLQISSPKVLHRLIKSRGKSQSRVLNPQLVAAEKLAQCPLELWDIVLHENSLEEASEHLCTWLEEYWAATHPPVRRLSRSAFMHRASIAALAAAAGNLSRGSNAGLNATPMPGVVRAGKMVVSNNNNNHLGILRAVRRTSAVPAINQTAMATAATTGGSVTQVRGGRANNWVKAHHLDHEEELENDQRHDSPRRY